MRFLINAPAYIKGAFIACQIGARAILELPDTEKERNKDTGLMEEVPQHHVSLSWEPLDQAARDAQIRVHKPKKNGLSGNIEHSALSISANDASLIKDGWKGKPIGGEPEPDIDAKTGKATPVRVIPLNEQEAPLDHSLQLAAPGQGAKAAGTPAPTPVRAASPNPIGA